MTTTMRVLALWFGTLLALPVHGSQQVAVPVRLDMAFLQHMFTSQAFTDADRTARVWDDGSGCNFLVLSSPQLVPREEGVGMRAAAEARVGQPIGGQCLAVLDWQGLVDVVQRPTLEPGGTAVRFEVVDSQLYETDGSKGLATGIVWDRVKTHVHPRLGGVRIDLAPALDDLRGLLPLFLPADTAGRVRALVDTVRLGDVRVAGQDIVVDLHFDIDDPQPRQAPPARPLTESELARLEEHSREWDSFLTFIVKYAAALTGLREIRQDLLAILLDGRQELVEALATDHRAGEPDPVRLLFMRTWERLAPVLRALGPEAPGEAGLYLLSFVTAVDALHALDTLGPQVDLDISADGLRRLARVLAPASPEDPLRHDQEVDHELRRLFDFGPPISPPRDNPDVDPTGWLLRRAFAGESIDEGVIARLNGWAPEVGDLDEYLPLVNRLLLTTAGMTLEGRDPGVDLRPVYEALVLATAWQESCWRQFVRDNGKLRVIRSHAGAVGIMQVLPAVWRGFYDARGLQRDIAYNARAGSEILMHYFVDYAMRKGEHIATGRRDSLARASYAAYNGGPSHLRRYRKPDVAPSLRRIDEAFWSKFQQIRRGDESVVAECFSG